MNDREDLLFKQYEQQTIHRSLLKTAETLSRLGWVLLLVTIAVFYFMGTVPISYYTLIAALVLLGVSLCISIAAERVRKKIQVRVDAKLRPESHLSGET